MLESHFLKAGIRMARQRLVTGISVKYAILYRALCRGPKKDDCQKILQDVEEILP